MPRSACQILFEQTLNMFPQGRSQITKTFNLTQTENKMLRVGGRGSRLSKLQKKKILYDPVLYRMFNLKVDR